MDFYFEANKPWDYGQKKLVILYEQLEIPDKDRSFQGQVVRTFWKVKILYLGI